MNSFDPEHFEALKRASLGQVLFKCARLMNEQGIEQMRRQTGLDQLRLAHTTLFPHLELDGIRLGELARKVGVTKQAVAQWVDELAQMGLLERIPDPSDRRAKLIVFTERGKRGLLEGLGTLAAIEHELSEAIGPEKISDLLEGLTSLLSALERRATHRAR